MPSTKATVVECSDTGHPHITDGSSGSFDWVSLKVLFITDDRVRLIPESIVRFMVHEVAAMVMNVRIFQFFVVFGPSWLVPFVRSRLD